MVDLIDFRWVFHVGFCWIFLMGFLLDLVFIDFGVDLKWVFWWVWVVVVIVGLCWVGGWKIVFFFFAELLWSLGKRGNSNEVESQTREKERERGGERKKKSNTRATVTVHICTVTVARCINTQFYTHWCVKWNFFLYFRRLCTQWCGCSKYDL